MKKLLFVDDDPNLLAGLECSLRKLRSEWNMSFVIGGRAAVELVEKTSFDVVVTDLHMPGVGGLELLSRVKEGSPNAVRLVLSGTSDRNTVMRSIGVAHQFVTKPCHPGELKAVVRRALALRELLANERLIQLVSRLDSLPSLPALVLEMEDLLTRGSGSISDVGRIVAKDVAMSAKVLHLSNSAFFGSSQTFTSPAEATVYLGLETITALMMTTEIFSRQGALSPETLEHISSRSTLTGALARTLLKHEGLDSKTADQAFLAGLLHQTGLVVLANELPGELAEAWKHAKRVGISPLEGERRVIGASHAAVGAYLMGIWGLPDPIVEAIAFCDAPSALPHDQISIITALHVARSFVREKEGVALGTGEVGLDQGYLVRLGLGDRLPRWRELCSPLFEGRAAA